MPTPGEHQTVQARILAYAEAIGWTMVSREEAGKRREIGDWTCGLGIMLVDSEAREVIRG